MIYINNLIRTLDKTRLAVILVLVSYMFQGVASLIYQVSWEQAMESTVGMALPTVSIIVCTFFLGMGLGAYVFGRVGLSPKWAGKLFVITQICLVLAAFIFIITNGLGFVCFLQTELKNWLWCVYLLRVIALGLFLLIPAFFIGAAFPLLQISKPLVTLPDKAQKLYLANLFGSMAGALLVGFIMLPNIGLKECTIIAILLNVLAVVLFIWANNIRIPQVEAINCLVVSPAVHSVSRKAANKQNNAINKGLFILIIMAAAFFNMLLELLFIRLMALYIGSSAFAFSLASALQLFALTCGSFIANFIYKQKSDNFWSIFVFLNVVAAFWLLAEILFFPDLSMLIANQRHFWTNYLDMQASLSFCVSHLIILLLFMFIPCLCLGASLPFYFQLRQLYPKAVPIKSSYAYALNLFASVAGCFSGGVLVFPILSQWTDYAISLAFTISAMTILFVGLLVYGLGVLSKTDQRKNYLFFGTIAIIFLTLFYSPLVQHPILPNGKKLLFYKEGLNSTVSLSANENENLIRLQTDGQTEATLRLHEKIPAVISDETTQVLLGLLPDVFSLHEPKNAFLLGFGSGVTAQAILAYPKLNSLTASELEPAVITAARRLKRCLPDTRLNIDIRDGRSLLSMINGSYDIVVSQPGEPWRSSSRYLYTLEFWRLVKSRLRSDGVFCQWIPLYAIDKVNLLNLCATFTIVFPNTFVIRTKNAGELILLAYNTAFDGKNEQEQVISTMVEAAIQRCKLKEIRRNLVKLGLDDLPALLSIFKLTPESFQQWLLREKNKETLQVNRSKFLINRDSFPINRDNFPVVQYRLQSLIIQQGIGINTDIDKWMPESPVEDFLLCYKKLVRNNMDKFSTVSALLHEAQLLVARNDFSRAIICLQDVIDQQADNFEAHFVLGKIFCNLNKEQEGLSQIKWASKIEPANFGPNLYVTLFYALKNDWTMAKENILMLEKKLPDDRDVRYLAEQINSRCKLDKNDNKIRKLMLKCHYPI